jgi:hypothetical protein
MTAAPVKRVRSAIALLVGDARFVTDNYVETVANSDSL